MMEFLTFKTLITPSVILIVYLLGMLLIPLAVYLVFKKVDHKLSKSKLITAQIVSMLFLELLWHMLNEFVIVYFKIYQALL